MSRKIVIAAGGTGGHLFPAQLVAKELQIRRPDLEISFAGAGLSESRYFDRKEFPYREISSATPFKGNFVRATYRILRGCYAALQWLRHENPELVVGFGSFHCFPVLTAAWMLRIPLVLFESNRIPGKVVRLFSRSARVTAVPYFETAQALQGQCVEVAMPLPLPEPLSAEEARSALGLDPREFTLLVFGGSQGALALNAALREMAPDLKGVQVLHITGRSEETEKCQAVYAQYGIKARVTDFESRMALAWKAAHFAICRSGAATVAEQTAFEVPALFIPYPYGAEDHQTENARAVCEKGGAFLLPQAEMNRPKLQRILEEALQTERLEAMRASLRSLKVEKKQSLADLVLSML